MKNFIQPETEISNLPDLNTIVKIFRLPLLHNPSYPKLLKPSLFNENVTIEETKQREIILISFKFIQK